MRDFRGFSNVRLMRFPKGLVQIESLRVANTRERFIYIHGTKHEAKIGSPASCGCIRMRNADVVELFDLVDPDTPVIIEE